MSIISRENGLYLTLTVLPVWMYEYIHWHMEGMCFVIASLVWLLCLVLNVGRRIDPIEIGDGMTGALTRLPMFSSQAHIQVQGREVVYRLLTGSCGTTFKCHHEFVASRGLKVLCDTLDCLFQIDETPEKTMKDSISRLSAATMTWKVLFVFFVNRKSCSSKVMSSFLEELDAAQLDRLFTLQSQCVSREKVLGRLSLETKGALMECHKHLLLLLGAMVKIPELHDTHEDAFIHRGIPELILPLLTFYTTKECHESLQQWALVALFHCSESSCSSSSSLVIPTILKAMESSIDSMDIQRLGCMNLCNVLLPTHASRGEPGEEKRRMFYQLAKSHGLFPILNHARVAFVEHKEYTQLCQMIQLLLQCTPSSATEPLD